MGVAAFAPVRAQQPVDTEYFEKNVRPILTARCTGCHGADLQEATLRLDTVAALKKGGPRGPLLTPDGTLLKAVRYSSALLKMPPSNKLPDSEIAVLEQWVKNGAPLPKTKEATSPAPPKAGAKKGIDMVGRRQHWAYFPVKRPLEPPVEKSGIDSFVLAKLEKTGLTLAPEADKRTLIRRATFDLTGLPPKPDEIKAFLADTAPNAYEKLLDRLLASPAYGERWARHWLDLVRYGESMGHELDFDIPNAYQYRDYLIRALNADVPYDQMLREHLAGDLLARPRLDPKTGRNESLIATGFWWLGEGKHSPVDVKQEQADRTDNQIDVFGKAFLAQTLACARCHDHKFDPIPTKDYYGLYGVLKSSRYENAAVADSPARFAQLAKEVAALRPHVTPSDTPALASEGGLSDFTQWKAAGPAFATLGKPGDVVLQADEKQPVLGVLTRTTAHSALNGRRLEGALRSPTFTLDKDFLHLRVWGKQARVHLIVESFQVIRDPIYGPLQHGIGNPTPQWITINLKLWKGKRGYIELSDSPHANIGLGTVGDPNRPFDGWIACDGVALTDSPRPPVLAEATVPAVNGADYVEAAKKLAAIENALPIPTRVMAMADGDGENEYVFLRGNHVARGDEAPRLKLALCGRESAPMPQVPGSGRLELSQWIASAQHPLTARVIVNRLWKHHFGVGIVPTTDDFGHMGEKPTHPELLDWLASELPRQGWSLKAMHKLIMTSATYKQRSDVVATPTAVRLDPNNKLLWRMNVRRLEGEAIRDSLLAVSGRLDSTLYGPPVNTYLTEFVEGRGRPAQGPLDGAGRRSIYLSVRRNFLSPWLQAFDFPTPFTCIGRRSVSNVPAQALALMNGPFVRQQAEVWAERVLRELPSATAEQRIQWLYEVGFGRAATAAELSDAKAFVGDSTDKITWADLCHVLLNVKEFIFIK